MRWLLLCLLGVAACLALSRMAPWQGISTLDGVAWADDAPSSPGAAVLVYGHGGILTEDGTLWQYHPDKDRWLTIDEAFRGEGRETHVLPLPVPADQIQDMVTFAFILTKTGDTWIYQILVDSWKRLDLPSRVP